MVSIAYNVQGFMSAWRMHTKHSATLHNTDAIRCIILSVGKLTNNKKKLK